MAPGQPQLWRLSNSSADTVLDLQVLYDGVPQTVQIVAFDGVPAGSQDGTTSPGQPVPATDVLIPTAGRAEFIVNPPGDGVTTATLVTLAINTGPDGDNDPQRAVADIETVAPPTTTASTSSNDSLAAASTASGSALATSALNDASKVAASIGPRWSQRFAGLAAAKPTRTRTLYFSENNPLSEFYITEQGAVPTLFDHNNPPAIITIKVRSRSGRFRINHSKSMNPHPSDSFPGGITEQFHRERQYT